MKSPTHRPAARIWIALPSWRSDSFTAAAAEHGIAVAPATALTVDRSHAPNAIRGALASPPPAVLASMDLPTEPAAVPSTADRRR